MIVYIATTLTWPIRGSMTVITMVMEDSPADILELEVAMCVGREVPGAVMGTATCNTTHINNSPHLPASDTGSITALV